MERHLPDKGAAPTYAEVGIENTFNRRRIDVRALVDSGSVFFTVPAHVAVQLGFDILHPATQTLSVNPANPFVPGALAK
jgi:hypothetical protein